MMTVIATAVYVTTALHLEWFGCKDHCIIKWL